MYYGLENKNEITSKNNLNQKHLKPKALHTPKQQVKEKQYKQQLINSESYKLIHVNHAIKNSKNHH